MPSRRTVAGADVHNLIGRAHHGSFVFNHHHRVPRVAQLLEDFYEPLRVARMQPHARLVQDKERVDEPRPEAGGEVHAFGFAAGKRTRGTIQREITKADFVQKIQPRTHFLKDQADGIGGREVSRGDQSFNQAQRVADGQRVKVGERQSLVGDDVRRL